MYDREYEKTGQTGATSVGADREEDCTCAADAYTPPDVDDDGWCDDCQRLHCYCSWLR